MLNKTNMLAIAVSVVLALTAALAAPAADWQLAAMSLLAASADAQVLVSPDQGAFQMELAADRFSGSASLRNPGAEAITIDKYEIQSSTNSLSPGGWLSIADRGPHAFEYGTTFYETAASSSLLAERTQYGQATFQPQATWSIGQPLVPEQWQADYRFYYSRPDNPGKKYLAHITPSMDLGTIVIIAFFDTDRDGVFDVDEAGLPGREFTIADFFFGDPGFTTATDAHGVIIADATAYTQYTITDVLTGGGASASLPNEGDLRIVQFAVPEPATLTLLALGSIAMLVRRRRAGG